MQNIDSLILDMLEFVAREPRSYRETLEAWRTSCPRLTVWEDAVDRGFVSRDWVDGGMRVKLTAAGQEFLREAGRAAAQDREPSGSLLAMHHGRA